MVNNDMCFKLENNGYKLEIIIGNNCAKDSKEKLESYLFNLSLPINIFKLYKAINSIFLSKLHEFSKLIISIVKEENLEYIEYISFINGEFQTVIAHKNNKKIKLDKEGSWVYMHGDFTVRKFEDMYSHRLFNLDEKFSEEQRINIAEKEVEYIKKLTKKIIMPKKDKRQ